MSKKVFSERSLIRHMFYMLDFSEALALRKYAQYMEKKEKTFRNLYYSVPHSVTF